MAQITNKYKLGIQVVHHICPELGVIMSITSQKAPRSYHHPACT